MWKPTMCHIGQCLLYLHCFPKPHDYTLSTSIDQDKGLRHPVLLAQVHAACTGGAGALRQLWVARMSPPLCSIWNCARPEA